MINSVDPDKKQDGRGCFIGGGILLIFAAFLFLMPLISLTYGEQILAALAPLTFLVDMYLDPWRCSIEPSLEACSLSKIGPCVGALLVVGLFGVARGMKLGKGQPNRREGRGKKP